MENIERIENNMEDQFSGIVGSVTGVFAWIFTHIWNFGFLQIPSHPITSEFIISGIRFLFGVATAVVAYLAIHWIKKNITHEIKGKK